MLLKSLHFFFSNIYQRYGYRFIPARMARKFHIGKPLYSTSGKISTCSGVFQQFRLISPEIKDSASMSLLHIKLNLDLQNKPKTIPSFLSSNTVQSFASKDDLQKDNSIRTRGMEWLMQSCLTNLESQRVKGVNCEQIYKWQHRQGPSWRHIYFRKQINLMML